MEYSATMAASMNNYFQLEVMKLLYFDFWTSGLLARASFHPTCRILLSNGTGADRHVLDIGRRLEHLIAAACLLDLVVEKSKLVLEKSCVASLFSMARRRGVREVNNRKSNERQLTVNVEASAFFWYRSVIGNSRLTCWNAAALISKIILQFLQ
mmetsp:Transcript_14192/g.26561  ORF Transcript_14192/g.26561 Transcript_14192/m.26561 type:complete len:154 (-) Transcript_14192:259-720(-)